MKKTPLLSFIGAALCVMALTVTDACDRRDIHQVVKEMAEAPVDTTGFTVKTVQTNNFSGVEIDCFADVTFHQTDAGTPPHVRLMAPDEVLGHVATKTADDMLLISTDRRYRMPEKAVIVIDIYAPFASKFTLNGGKCLRLGRLHLNSPLTLDVDGVGAIVADSLAAHEVYITLDGSGSVDLRGMVTDRTDAAVNGTGNIYLAGRSRTVNVSATGGGHIDTSHLESTPSVPAKP